jgi:hypothetical protein
MNGHCFTRNGLDLFMWKLTCSRLWYPEVPNFKGCFCRGVCVCVCVAQYQLGPSHLAVIVAPHCGEYKLMDHQTPCLAFLLPWPWPYSLDLNLTGYSLLLQVFPFFSPFFFNNPYPSLILFMKTLLICLYSCIFFCSLTQLQEKNWHAPVAMLWDRLYANVCCLRE